MEDTLAQEILDLAPFAYAYHAIVLDEAGRPADYVFLDVNPAFEEMTGMSRELVLGKRVSEVLPGLGASTFDWVAVYGKVALAGDRQEFTQYSEPLGRWYKVTAFAPKPGYFVTIFQDFTAEFGRIRLLEEKEQQINALSAELETVFNSTQDAMFLVRVDNGEFRYLRTNVAHQILTGYSLAEVKDKTPVEAAGPEMGRILEESYRRCVESKAPLALEQTLPLPAGARIWSTVLTPVLENGRVKYLVGSRKDITLQRQAEQASAEMLRRLEAMFKGHAAVMLLIEPLSGRIVDANPAACAFYGYSKEELLALCIQDINMLPKEEVARRRLQALQGQKKYFVFPHRLKNGEIRMVDVYSCPINYGEENLLFSIIFDVTDREKYREDLYREKELLRITFHSIGDAVVTTDEHGRITSLNPVAEAITGWSEQEAKGRNSSEVLRLFNEFTGEQVTDPVAKVLSTGTIIGLANHTVLLTKDGRKVPIADSAAPIQDNQGRVFGVVMVFRDVAEEKAWQEKILFLSYHDGLTGLFNRRFMEEEIKRLEQSRDLPLAFIMADVNGLKLTNDVFGHKDGDELLKKTAEVLQQSCRKEDIIARWGGDEFLILLPKTSAQTAEEIIRRIKNKCSRASAGGMLLSVALGYAVKTEDSAGGMATIKEAEELMYRHKLIESRSYRNIVINTLLATLYAKSSETEEHAERLHKHCLAIGRELKLAAKAMDELALLAMLHDIGKVGIKESVLQKPGTLTPEEWEEMKRHPQIGYRIAANTPELATVAEYILWHHERWDGKGYPEGLAGEEIPLLCRILAVADAYDAMTNQRSYRKAIGRDAALAEISRHAGTQFDPDVADVFVRIMAQAG